MVAFASAVRAKCDILLQVVCLLLFSCLGEELIDEKSSDDELMLLNTFRRTRNGVGVVCAISSIDVLGKKKRGGGRQK